MEINFLANNPFINSTIYHKICNLLCYLLNVNNVVDYQFEFTNGQITL